MVFSSTLGFLEVFHISMKNTKTFYGTEEAKTDLIMSLYSHLYNMVETLCHGLRAGRQERTQCRLVRRGET